MAGSFYLSLPFFLKAMQQIRIQTATVTVPNGTASRSTGLERITLDQYYDRVVGFAVLRQGSIGSNVIGIGLSNDGGVIADVALNDIWVPDTSVPVSDRFTQVSIPAKGKVLTINWENLGSGSTSGASTFQVLFLLRKDD